MTNEEIKQFLLANAQKDYSDFSASLIPGCDNMLGVRIPVLRKYAKALAKEDWKEALNNLSEDSFEELALQGMVLGYAKAEFEELVPYLREYIPKVNSWSINDTFCSTFKCAQKNSEQVWDFLMEYKDSDKEFEQRVVAIMLMSHYLNETYIDRVLEVYDSMKHDGYYQKMGIAWGIATAYAKFPVQTKEYMKHNHLDDFTHNKAIQKMIESYRISDEDKAWLRTIKRE